VLLIVAAVGLGQSDRLVARFGAQPGDSWTGHRLQMLRDLSVSWGKFPLFGTGMGTHPVIFPMLDRSDVPLFASHAENEYAQLLTESGAVGVLIFLAFLAIVLGALRRATRGSLSPASSAAIGLGYGIIAVLIQSATDFGQHTPAIAVLTAVSCALILNLAELRWRERGTGFQRPAATRVAVAARRQPARDRGGWGLDRCRCVQRLARRLGVAGCRAGPAPIWKSVSGLPKTRSTRISSKRPSSPRTFGRGTSSITTG
jgi:O-antigen ligase